MSHQDYRRGFVAGARFIISTLHARPAHLLMPTGAKTKPASGFRAIHDREIASAQANPSILLTMGLALRYPKAPAHGGEGQ